MHRYLTVICAGLVSLALAVLAVPRMQAYAQIAGWSQFGPDASKIDFANGDLLAATQDYCKASARLPDDAQLSADCARLSLALAAEPPRNGPAARLAAGQARDAALQSVQAAPNRSSGWSLLGMAENWLDPSSVQSAEYIRMGRLTGPYLASNILARTKLALQHWRTLPGNVRAQAVNDMRYMWEIRRFKFYLVRYYLNSDYATRAVMRDTFLLSKADEAQFDKMVKAHLNRIQK